MAKNWIHAYAIIDTTRGQPATVDFRVPVFWYRHVAEGEAQGRGLREPDFQVVRVRVQIEPRKGRA